MGQMNYGELIRARISTELLEQVKQLAERQDCNVSEIVRLALIAYVEQRGNDERRGPTDIERNTSD